MSSATVLPTGVHPRNGQWVRFELEPNPKLLVQLWQNVQAEGGSTKRVLRAGLATLESANDVAALTEKMQMSACGRFVGIFVKGGTFQDGQGGLCQMPDSIAPQRRILGPNGEQNLEWIWEGKAQTVLLALVSVRNVAPVLLREDVPAHRDKTCHENWNPRG